MKQYYHIVIVVLLIIIGVLVFARKTTNEQPAAASISPSISQSPVPVPVQAVKPTTPPKNTVTNIKPTVTPPKTITGNNSQTLPLYYGDSVASSTAEVRVGSPAQNTSIYSPITVTGQAVGSWFFEAVFPIFLVDANGHLIAQGTVRAQSDWTSNDFVPFIGTLSFPRQISGSKGWLVFKKDNPSGLPQNDKSVQMQVTFD